jgi:hypothetical protein
MIERATDDTRSIDAITVCSFFQAFRNRVEQELRTYANTRLN